MNNKIYLTREEYDNYVSELESLSNELVSKLNKISKYEMLKGESFYSLATNIKHKLDDLKKIIIVDKKEEEIININDIVTVNVIYPDYTETLTFELVSGLPNLSSKIMKLSINCPLGEAVYQQRVGEEISYIANNTKVKINIISKSKQKSLKL